MFGQCVFKRKHLGYNVKSNSSRTARLWACVDACIHLDPALLLSWPASWYLLHPSKSSTLLLPHLWMCCSGVLDFTSFMAKLDKNQPGNTTSCSICLINAQSFQFGGVTFTDNLLFLIGQIVEFYVMHNVLGKMRISLQLTCIDIALVLLQ